MGDNLPIGENNNSEAPYNEKEEFECNVCGISIDKKGICKSNACFKADNM